MVCPDYFELVGLKSALLQTQMRVSSELHLLRIENETPLSGRKIHWEEVARRLFKDFVQLLDQDNRRVAEHDSSKHIPTDVALFEPAKRSYDL